MRVTDTISALAALFLLMGGVSLADDRVADNSIFAEGLGPGIGYSINYERIVENTLGLRIGASYLPLQGQGGQLSCTGSISNCSIVNSPSVGWFTMPAVVSYLGIASGNHALELGLGGVFVYATAPTERPGIGAMNEGLTLWGAAIMGYRRQPLTGGLMFRVGATALVGKGFADANDRQKVGILLGPYISAGWSF